MLSSHPFITRHLFAQFVGVVVLALLLRHDGRSADRGEVIVWPVVTSTRVLQVQPSLMSTTNLTNVVCDPM